MVIIETNFLTIFFWGWILLQKKCNLLFVLLLLPVFIPFVVFGQFLLISFPFALITFIVVLALKNKNKR